MIKKVKLFLVLTISAPSLDDMPERGGIAPSFLIEVSGHLHVQVASLPGKQLPPFDLMGS
jgi:hypothetical protein